MSDHDAIGNLSSVARAVAETRASQVGMPVNRWLEGLVLQHDATLLTSLWKARVHTPVATMDPRDARIVFDHPPAHLQIRSPDQTMALIQPSYLTDPGAAPTSLLFNKRASHPEPWSAFDLITAFPSRIEQAALLLSAAFANGDVGDFRLPQRRAQRGKAAQRWYMMIVDACVFRSREVRNALVHNWTPRGRAEQLWDNAFLSLCELTPVRQELLALCKRDRGRASAELAKHLEVATEQFVLSASLVADVDVSGSAETTDEQRLAKIRSELLERAGGAISLTVGSKRLGVSRQALHKRIKTRTVLGIMDDGNLVLPEIQWMMTADRKEIVQGLGKVLPLFERAGDWSALQFLLDPDPNLGRPPIDVLREGAGEDGIESVAAAARAYLGLDEE